MQWEEPAALAIGLGLLAGPLGAVAVRRGRRALGAAIAAAAGAGLAMLATAGVPGGPDALGTAGAPSGLATPAPGGLAALAAAAGAGAALALPGFGAGAFGRRRFGAGYGRTAFTGGLACVRLPARCAGAAPTRLLDAADRLRLESLVCEVERKSGAEPAVALVARAAEHEDARGRAGAWLAAVAACGALTVAVPPLGALGAAAAAWIGGRALTRHPRVRRFFVAESVLEACALEAALGAFAQAGLVRAPRERGALVFAALAEGRAIALLGRGLPARIAETMARAAAEGLAAGRPLEGLEAALGALGAASGDEPLAIAAVSEGQARPHPVRVED